MNNNYQNIPEQLQGIPQWVVHRDKIPFNPVTSQHAKAGIPETWGTFSQALAAVNEGNFDGIGFEFQTDGYLTGIDLDHCIFPDGTLTPEARQIVDRLDTYTEISTSGDGLHLIIAGEKPKEISRCKREIVREDGKKVAFECYDQSRYFVMTGNVFEDRREIYGGPDYLERIAWYCKTFIQPEKEKKSGVLDWEDEIGGKDERPLPASSNDSIEYALNKDSVFFGLWNNTQHTGNESADDLALLNKLAYWLNKDPAAMRSSFLQSPYAQTKDEKLAENWSGKTIWPIPFKKPWRIVREPRRRIGKHLNNRKAAFQRVWATNRFGWCGCPK